MKKILTVLFLSLTVFAVAQDTTKTIKADSTKKDTTNWKRGGVIGMNFSQTSLSNWAAGGQNSIAVNAYTSLFANYKKGTITWDNTLDLNFGLVQQGRIDFRKSDDKIDLSSKFGQYAFKKVWYYSGLFGFKTQFAPGFNYASDGSISSWISDFASPAYALLAVGLDYKPKPEFSVMISPLTGRVTLVMAQTLANEGAFGVTKAIRDANGVVITPGENMRYEFGGYIKAQFRKDIMKNVNLQSKLELFSNYVDRPENIDINWENLVAMKVNKYISASLSTHMIYDNDINIPVDRDNSGVIDATETPGPRLQFKQTFGIGLAAKF